MPDKLLPDAADPVGTLVFFLLVFVVVGVVFLFMHLLMGSVIRPRVPDAEKLTIYECGEPTVGSAWIQFDLRFYVVALLFVIFDVEVAFFFPWATVYGKLNQLANLPPKVTAMELDKLAPEEKEQQAVIEKERARLSQQLFPSGLSEHVLAAGIKAGPKRENKLASFEMKKDDKGRFVETETTIPIKPDEASTWATIAFFDILVFFGVLLVGFAYLWRRGDIDWVRAYAHHREPPVEPEKPLEQNKVAV